MSVPSDHMAPDGIPPDDNLQAGEYVIGSLPLAERMAFEARLKGDPALMRLVSAWEAHFEPLNDSYAEVPAPDLMQAIEARLFPAPAKPRRLPFWSGLMGGLVAAGIVVAVALQLLPGREPEGVPDLVATLAGAGQAVIFTASYDIETAELTVTQTSGLPPAEGKDYELWVIGASGVPVAVGVMPGPSGVMILPDLKPDFVLAISLEAKGGSTSGAPDLVLVTGPVTAL